MNKFYVSNIESALSALPPRAHIINVAVKNVALAGYAGLIQWVVIRTAMKSYSFLT